MLNRAQIDANARIRLGSCGSGTSLNASTWCGPTTPRCPWSSVAVTSILRRSGSAITEASTIPSGRSRFAPSARRFETSRSRPPTRPPARRLRAHGQRKLGMSTDPVGEQIESLCGHERGDEQGPRAAWRATRQRSWCLSRLAVAAYNGQDHQHEARRDNKEHEPLEFVAYAIDRSLIGTECSS
jgi:hypothetical protein